MGTHIDEMISGVIIIIKFYYNQSKCLSLGCGY